MKEVLATVTSKGQITIPVEIRELLGLSKGSKVAFVVCDDGTIAVRPPRYPDIASLAGTAGMLPKPMTWKEMREIAYEDRHLEKYGQRT